ncbi:hypothetical protein JNUCC1_00305 [Lentibacillus sp. JNUCC-1]|uniref:CotO family spore coat protein n=1 Tax=Lentibacillus sp. JNUCC-1 TaxID=2654513 RepID=UPI0012E7FE1B|nr:CotO family spore coat protein [Lentibacillus sp. JNUCC-1]MUV36502.1 hypothetical protein [Lentibacillus sp. JNUCC-1]
MAEKRYAKSPLLYVEQSGINEPKARMQHQYQSPKKKPNRLKKEESVVPQKKRTKKTANKNKQNEQLVEEEIEQNEEQNINEFESVPQTEEEDVQEKMQDKKFKDMSIDEKLVYLTNRSPHAPVLRCEIKTEDRTYRGVIMELDDNIVKVRVGRRTSITKVQVTDIKSVRLLGLI